MDIRIVGLGVMSFLTGSIPFGYILAKKMAGIDVREIGSGNIGSTNVKRAAGAKVSLYTQLCDIFKGLIPVLIAIMVTKNVDLGMKAETVQVMCAILAILGHNYTPFLKFKGGKGVNTTLGSFLLIAPIPVLASVAVHKGLGLVTSIVSIRSLLLGATIPVAAYLMKMNSSIVVGGIIGALLIVIRHKSNIQRLIKGEEK